MTIQEIFFGGLTLFIAGYLTHMIMEDMSKRRT